MDFNSSNLFRSTNVMQAAIALALLAVILIGSIVSKQDTDKRLTAIEAKLAALESAAGSAEPSALRQSFQDAPAASAARGATRSPLLRTRHATPPTAKQRVQQQRNRLVQLETGFNKERVDNAWAAETEAAVNDILSYVLLQSKIDSKDASVACRSDSCRIRVDMDRASDPDDLVLGMSAEMAGLLPRSKIVVLPDRNGNKRVEIFASR